MKEYADRISLSGRHDGKEDGHERGREERGRGRKRSGKGVKLAFWGVHAKEVDPGAKRHPGEDRISRDATKTQFASRHFA